MAKPRQRHRISFAGEYRIQYPQSAESGDVAHYTMDLKIHLIESLLHVQDMLCCHLDQAAAVSPKRTNCADHSRLDGSWHAAAPRNGGTAAIGSRKHRSSGREHSSHAAR